MTDRDRIKQAFEAQGAALLIQFARQHYGTDTLDRGDEVEINSQGGLCIKKATGQWYCHADGQGGDCFDLIGHTLFNSAWNPHDAATFKRCLDVAADFAGLALQRSTDWNPFTDGEHVATYPYQDEHGALSYEVHRFELRDPSHPAYPDKTFRPKVPGKGWGLKKHGIEPLPYRLPRVIEAVRREETVYIPEGEKDVDALEALGLTATCNSGGAGKWKAHFARYFEGACVVILPDHDAPGRDHAQQMARSLGPVAASVRIIDLPGLDAKEDVSDWIARGGDADTLQQLVREASPVQRGTLTDEGNDSEPADAPARDSAATMAVKLVAEHCDLFHSDRSMLFAQRRRDGVCFLLASASFEQWASGLFFERYGRVLPQATLRDAVATLKGQAMRQQADVHVRTSGSIAGGVVYVALGPTRVAHVTPGAIEVLPACEAEARFWHPDAAEALPDPDLSGTLADVGRALDLGGDALLIAMGWMLASLLPGGPYPVLAVYGPQGSGKSTRCRHLVRSLDPAKLVLRTAPKSEDDLIVAARSSHVMAFDNLSGVSDWLSDALCRVATGAGLAKRKLYSDLDPVVVSVKRPVIVNAIIDVVRRSDLADRLMLLELPRIETRMTERQVEARFQRLHAKVLGAVLQGVQAALQHVDTVTLPGLPRMADACLWAEAGLQGLGAEPHAFYRAFTQASRDANRSIVESDLVGSLVVTIAERGGFAGTATELLARMQEMASGQKRSLPKSAPALGTELRRLDPALRNALGWGVTFEREPHRRLVKILGPSPSSLSSPSCRPDSGDAYDSHDRHDSSSADLFRDAPGAPAVPDSSGNGNMRAFEQAPYAHSEAVQPDEGAPGVVAGCTWKTGGGWIVKLQDGRQYEPEQVRRLPPESREAAP